MVCGVENHCKEACPPGAVLMQAIILCWAPVTHLAIRDLHEHVVTGVQGVRVGMRVWTTALRCSGGSGREISGGQRQNSRACMAPGRTALPITSGRRRTWKYLPHTRQAYTLTGLRETEQHFSKSKSRF